MFIADEIPINSTITIYKSWSHPIVQSHLLDKSDLDNFEIAFNYLWGFSNGALPINNLEIMNCTI